MSIAVIFKNPTGVEITARLFERLREADLLKHDVPRFAGDDVRAAYLTALQGEIVRVCTEPGLLLGFMKDLWSISEPLLLTSLPWGAVEDTVPEDLEVAAAVRFPHNDTLTYSVWENTFEIVHEGQRIRLDSNAAKIMDCILTSGVLSVEKLAKSCDMPKGELLKYLSGMIKQGILIGRDPIAARTQVASRSFFARTDAPCL